MLRTSIIHLHDLEMKARTKSIDRANSTHIREVVRIQEYYEYLYAKKIIVRS